MNPPRNLSLGPVVADVAGLVLTDDDRRRLTHPLVGGVILFTRNYQSPSQLAALTAEIHDLRRPALLIAVDHEGGRVQRFRDGFTAIPPMRRLGDLWDTDQQRACRAAEATGYVLAAELLACGVDLSFAPVLDIDYGNSSIIGDRAFHAEPQAVVDLAQALTTGMKKAGMAAVGKHFPGHGHVAADSHLEVPVDERSLDAIERSDLLPFRHLIDHGLAGIMPAHIVFSAVDAQPAGFSALWLKDILRRRFGFDGAIFSDDLSMEGAKVAGGVIQRAQAAFGAGCDLVLVCNNPEAVDELLDGLDYEMPAPSLARLARMHGRGTMRDFAALRRDARYGAALRGIAGAEGHEAT